MSGVYERLPRWPCCPLCGHGLTAAEAIERRCEDCGEDIMPVEWLGRVLGPEKRAADRREVAA